jgi:hypothetical protein
MAYVAILGAYFFMAVFVALLGIRKKFGFWGYFFASLLLTPAIGALLVIASGPMRWRRV